VSAAAVVPIRRARAAHESVTWTPPNPVEVSALRTIMRVTPRRRRIAVALAFTGRTQLALADRVGAAQPSVHHWVKGTCLPKLIECDELARAFNLTLGEMWGD